MGRSGEWYVERADERNPKATDHRIGLAERSRRHRGNLHALRSLSSAAMSRNSPLGAILRGAFAGAVGVVAMDTILYASYRPGGGEMPPIDWEFGETAAGRQWRRRPSWGADSMRIDPT